MALNRALIVTRIILRRNFPPFTIGSCAQRNCHTGQGSSRDNSNGGCLKKLTAEQYFVCREKGTEPPFSGQYYNFWEEGTYHCICCRTELFSSESKYDSHSGWPSFSSAVEQDAGDSNVITHSDTSHGMVRSEVLCKKCSCHLGHVFDDGPPPTGLRYCINSVALEFLPKISKE